MVDGSRGRGGGDSEYIPTRVLLNPLPNIFDHSKWPFDSSLSHSL